MSNRGEFTIVKELQFQTKEQTETINRLSLLLVRTMTELHELKHKED